MISTRSKYKKEYARILDSGPSSERDFGFARELIDAGYADGNYQLSKGRNDYGRVTHLLAFRINAKGRLFLDELGAAISKETWGYRARAVGIWVFGFASALAVGLISGLGVEVLKNYLPK